MGKVKSILNDFISHLRARIVILAIAVIIIAVGSCLTTKPKSIRLFGSSSSGFITHTQAGLPCFFLTLNTENKSFIVPVAAEHYLQVANDPNEETEITIELSVEDFVLCNKSYKDSVAFINAHAIK